MLILLPPSEGKTAPRTGAPLDLSALSFPELTATRATILAELVRLCESDPGAATTALGLGPSQDAEVAMNAALPHAPTARARDVYTGVLYDALGLRSLSRRARSRAARWIVVTSGLWGALRPSDRIPAYRLGGGVTLPGFGTLAAQWRPVLAATLADAAGDGLVVDLRSGMYESFWRPVANTAARTAQVRVLHERDGKRTVVSHFNKATKGQLARALLEGDAVPRTPAGLTDVLCALGWKAELTEPDREARPWQLDVVVTQVGALTGPSVP